MRNKKVLIYGASGGLGLGICKEFNNENYDVILAGRNYDKLENTRKSLNIAGEVIEFSITDDIDSDYFTDIDIVINASGMDIRKPLLEQSNEDIKKQLELNLFGVINITKAALKVFRERAHGQILHLGGFADGAWATPYYTVDVATRAGIYSFIESVNLELSSKDILVQYFCPLPADTEAERPYHDLWRSMGIQVVKTGKVAKEIINAVTKKKRVKIMGGTFNTLLSTNLRHMFPRFFTKFLLKPMGDKTMKYIDNLKEYK